MAKEPDESKDPRENVGLMKAIPKVNLGKEQEAFGRGKKAAFAEALGFSRQTVSRWISGKERMSNESVVKVAHTMGVSPLYILDLCDEHQIEAPHAIFNRFFLDEVVGVCKRWKSEGTFPDDIPDPMKVINWPDTLEELEERLKGFSGDYRDLHTLANDATAWYLRCCDDSKIGLMISRIMSIGNECARHE